MAKTTLIFGDSGTFKTTAIGHAARYFWETTGKRTRLISGEAGWVVVRDLIDAGLIEMFHISDQPNIISLMRRLSAGYWPEKLSLDGHMLTPNLAAPRDLEKKIALYAFEGLSSVSDLGMSDLAAKQRKVGDQGVGEFTEHVMVVNEKGQTVNAEEKFSYNNLNHYQFMQKEMLGRVRTFGALPVEHVILSAHEAKGEEEETRRAIRGPALAGKAATAKVMKDVGDCLHFEQYTVDGESKDKDGKTVRISRVKTRVFFRSHPDPLWAGTGIPVIYKCQPRVLS
ncbi:MAG: hypothetical protein ACRD22_17970, partial [Terriglobia bacterium]